MTTTLLRTVAGPSLPFLSVTSRTVRRGTHGFDGAAKDRKKGKDAQVQDRKKGKGTHGFDGAAQDRDGQDGYVCKLSTLSVTPPK